MLQYIYINLLKFCTYLLLYSFVWTYSLLVYFKNVIIFLFFSSKLKELSVCESAEKLLNLIYDSWHLIDR